MTVIPSFPAKTVSEFIAYAKVNASKVNMGSGGNGTADHLLGELFKMMAEIDMVHVPYRGEAPALTDMLGGQLHMMFATVPHPSSTSEAVNCGHWRLQRRRAGRDCRTFRRWAIFCQVTRRAHGPVSARPRTRPRKSSTNSTRKLMLASQTPS